MASKFSAVLGQRKSVQQEHTASIEEAPLVERTIRRGPGRPPGKRTHPDYQQTTIYIPRTLHDQVKIALIREGRKEFSELVETLLTDWISERQT